MVLSPPHLPKIRRSTHGNTMYLEMQWRAASGRRSLDENKGNAVAVSPHVSLQ
jgi:hypothetical protein